MEGGKEGWMEGEIKGRREKYIYIYIYIYREREIKRLDSYLSLQSFPKSLSPHRPSHLDPRQ